MLAYQELYVTGRKLEGFGHGYSTYLSTFDMDRPAVTLDSLRDTEIQGQIQNHALTVYTTT